MKRNLETLFVFAWNQAISCIFPAAIFLTLAVSKIVHIPGLHRYDFILIIVLLVQFVMYKTGIETLDELKVIFLFHLIGFALEVYKVKTGSWSYPGSAWTKLFGVPLYSGFMYSSIGSYMCQAWRRLNLELVHWKPLAMTIPMAVLIYANFFTDHFFYDMRWILMGLLILLFYKTKVVFYLRADRKQMPLIGSFVLIGFFIWIAENLATFFKGWEYPNQAQHWQVVSAEKISSWSLLVIISFILVAQLKQIKARSGCTLDADRENTSDVIRVE